VYITNHKSQIMLPYTNAEAGSKLKFKFMGYATHCAHCMNTSAKLLVASIAACIHGLIPRAFKYTAMSICLSIIEDDLQKNRVPTPRTQPKPKNMLNDVIVTFDAKME